MPCVLTPVQYISALHQQVRQRLLARRTTASRKWEAHIPPARQSILTTASMPRRQLQLKFSNSLVSENLAWVNYQNKLTEKILTFVRGPGSLFDLFVLRGPGGQGFQSWQKTENLI